MSNSLTLKVMQDEVCRRCFKDTQTFRSMVTEWINTAQGILAIENGIGFKQFDLLKNPDDVSKIPVHLHGAMIEYAVYKGHGYRGNHRGNKKLSEIAWSKWCEYFKTKK